MGRTKTTVRSSWRRFLPDLPDIARVLFLLPAVLFPTQAFSADLTLASKTYALLYQRELPGGGKDRFLPLYEYLSADAADLGGKPLSLHFYGWGRLDLGEESGSDKTAGEIGSAYVEYLHPQENGQAKLGRFFLAEGAAVETIDGIFVKVTGPIGLGASVYGGAPVESSILDGTRKGSSLFGGRAFFTRSGFVEIGLSYLKENGTFQEGKDRKLLGGDLWLRVAPPVELTAQASYNTSVRELASQRYAVRIVPGATFDISAGYETYTYKGLFQATLHPAFVSPSLDNGDAVQTIFGIVDWGFLPDWTVEVAVKNLRHDRKDPGDANRGELGLRYAYNGKKDVAGLSASLVAADRAENEYREFRGFGSYTLDKIRITLDALTQQFRKEISGKKSAYQVVASAGYAVLPYLSLSGDLTYTKSPTFDKDFAGLIRANLDLGTTTGGKK